MGFGMSLYGLECRMVKTCYQTQRCYLGDIHQMTTLLLEYQDIYALAPDMQSIYASLRPFSYHTPARLNASGTWCRISASVSGSKFLSSDNFANLSADKPPSRNSVARVLPMAKS
jgi:hypothetical protein